MKTRILLLFTQKAQSSAYQYGAEVATRICDKSGSPASLRDNRLLTHAYEFVTRRCTKLIEAGWLPVEAGDYKQP